jgi:rhodanese-related sulfurtransferase
MIKRFLAAFATLMVVVGCGSSSNMEKTMLTTNTIIIDVRTPAEFAEGHVEGAINLDLESGQFEAELPNLDPAQPYIVYCRSGRRSGVAVEIMKASGFAQITDYQTLENAANNTGLPIIE